LRITFGHSHERADTPHPLALLRARRTAKQPPVAPEKYDELALLHVSSSGHASAISNHRFADLGSEGIQALRPSFDTLRNQNSKLPLSLWRHYAVSWEGAMTSDEVVSRRRPARNGDKGVVDLAGDALKEVATLLQTELQLLRAEVLEKLSFTALSAALIGTGALLLMATIVLLLEAAITGLVAYGFSWPVATLIIAAATFLVGASLIWLGVNRLSLARLAPSKTLDQLQKDSTIANMR
jgi:hypothetical protein